MRSSVRTVAVALVAAAMAAAVRAQAVDPADAYRELRAREVTVRADMAAAPVTARTRTTTTVRALVRDYEDLARRHPASGYSDNALWQGAALAGDLFREFRQATDKQTARRLFGAIEARFPTSSLVQKVAGEIEALDKPPALTRNPGAPATTTVAAARTVPPLPAATPAVAATSPAPNGSRTTKTVEATLLEVRREVLDQAVRITLLLDSETPFSSEQLSNPARVFVDLRNTRALHALKDMKLAFSDDIVHQIRVGRPDEQRLRVVLDLVNLARFSIYPMYNPYRLVIDFERASGRAAPAPTLATVTPEPKPASTQQPARAASASVAATTTSTAPATGSGARGTRAAPAPGKATGRGATPAPASPSANGRGGYSLSRQLGLGIARIVIDPGHGGHDPGASSNGLTEAEIALDVALRLEKRLTQHPNVEVILTRRTSVYVPLEERTAVANKANADLFLSIHANASENGAARGTETYFLSFAPDAAAEAIAARENAGSSRNMRSLPDMVRAITLNDKIDESRDFARLVQAQLHEGSKKGNQRAKNLGVKQAPFQVLIGAAMPSILTEISFITNEDEGELLKTDKYRDVLAEALYNGVVAYQRSLKKNLVAANERK